MTDRELLEKAAKAAGVCPGDERLNWNPLANNDDAFRLQVALDMNVFQAAKSAYALPSDDDGTYEKRVRYADEGDDKAAATRRAIVRAAAAMADAAGAA